MNTLSGNSCPPSLVQPNVSLSAYMLKWRQRQLLVQRTDEEQLPNLPKLDDSDWVLACLQRSPIKLIRLAPNLGEAKLRFWAEAGQRAGKAVYLKIPSTPELPGKKFKFSWQLKRSLDRLLAALILLLLSPLLIGLALLIRSQSPGPILFYQWRVGERGRLFQIIKFRTMVEGAEQLHHQIMGGQTGLHKRKNDPRITPVGRWMRKYSLDELPQLFNVLRGEMSLVGPRPWALYDAIRVMPAMQHRLNALPGMTGAWQIMARSNLLDLAAVNRYDLDYLGNWSLWQDLKILLLTVPKVISGFGAY